MKTIIAGSRSITDYQYFLKIMSAAPWNPTMVLSGMAKGVDTMGEQWARENNIPLEFYPADWDKYGKRAGYLRNEEMAKYADALIAIWDGESKGTKHMIDIAKKKGLKIWVITTLEKI